MTTRPRIWSLLPLALVSCLVLVCAAALRKDPRHLPSPLLDRPAPAFSAARLGKLDEHIKSDDLLGQPWVLNVWASWCGACQQEHEVVKKLAAGPVPVYGLNYKDGSAPARAWLARLGDPYRASLSDPDGRIGMDFGVYGLPETFVIDGQGKVRYRHPGPLTQEQLDRHVLPLLKELKG